MQFKVGDMVVLKKGLKVGKRYGSLTLLPSMEKNLNSPRSIVAIDDQSDCIVDGLDYYYPSAMLSLYQPKEQYMPRFSIRKLDEGFAFGVWLYFKPFSMHVTIFKWVFNFRCKV